MNSVNSASLACTPTSDSRPRNDSYRSQIRYVLTTVSLTIRGDIIYSHVFHQIFREGPETRHNTWREVSPERVGLSTSAHPRAGLAAGLSGGILDTTRVAGLRSCFSVVSSGKTFQS